MSGFYPAPCHCPACDASWEEEDWDLPVEPDENLIPANDVLSESEPTVADIDAWQAEIEADLAEYFGRRPFAGREPVARPSAEAREAIREATAILNRLMLG